MTATSPLRSKLFWVGVLYFAEGFPLGIFFDIFPVHFRQMGVDLRAIGVMSLLGLAWSLKFLWAPAIDHFRHHRRWMATVDIAMAAIMGLFALGMGAGPWAWVAIGLFTTLSATNDIAIDGFTIELLDRDEMGIANGFRIGFYRAGMLAAGLLLVLSDYLGWAGAYGLAGILLAALAACCLAAPRERKGAERKPGAVAAEFRALANHPGLAIPALLLFAGLLAGATRHAVIAAGLLALALAMVVAQHYRKAPAAEKVVHDGPVFGAFISLLNRPYFLPVVAFILIFKLADTTIGFMIKPFWVDAGFSASEIGLVSVNLGLFFSILGGLVGGWFTDRVGIFHGLWILGLAQAVSNLGYAGAAYVIPHTGTITEVADLHRALIYSASALESFTQGLGTGAFLAFLMAIVDKSRAATEYAILSSLFALSRSIAGWAGGYGAAHLGYADFFLLTFLFGLPAYALLPWVKRILDETRAKEEAMPADPATSPASAD
jgi:PAT family beta-lactamase induction signal transducer AmpG